MALVVVAYPTLSESDFQRIQNFRIKFDLLYYNLIHPHFTLVFPTQIFDINTVLYEVENTCATASTFEITLHTAIVKQDDFKPIFHAFLLAEKGNSEIAYLHNRLYKGALEPALLKHIEYQPHITIGNTTEKVLAEEMVSKWNSDCAVISGKIDSLSVLDYTGSQIKELARVALLS